MRFEIAGDSTKSEPTVTLRLHKLVDDKVRLYARTLGGEEYAIIDLTPAGRIIRHPSVGTYVGFEVDLRGRVKLSDE